MIRDPHERKPRDHVAAPVVEEQRETRKEQGSGRHVVAETVFTGEEEEELADGKSGGVLGALGTKIVEFAKELFVRDRPGNSGDGQRQHKQLEQLGARNIIHAATRRAARLRSFPSTRRTRSRAIVKYSETASPIASTSRSTTISSAPTAENRSIAVRFLVITPNSVECRSDTLSARHG